MPPLSCPGRPGPITSGRRIYRRPFGPVLTFGRYTGWSIGEIAQVDPDELEWLRRAPIGRGYRAAIDAAFRELRERPLTLAGRRAVASA